MLDKNDERCMSSKEANNLNEELTNELKLLNLTGCHLMLDFGSLFES